MKKFYDLDQTEMFIKFLLNPIEHEIYLAHKC